MRPLQERGPVAALTDDPILPISDGAGVSEDSGILPAPRAPVWRLRALVLAVAAIAAAVDQLTKSLAVTHLGMHPVHLFASIYLRLELNSGTAFSLFQGFGFWIVVVGIVLVIVLLVVTRWVRTATTAIAIGLLLGGASGNLADRLFRGNHGAVIDFIYTRYWPTFNVADACIVLGAVVLIIASWRRPVAR